MIVISNTMGVKYSIIFLFVIVLFIPAFSIEQESQAKVSVFNVLEYGAVGDGKKLDTDAIQKAIDEARKTGNRAQVLVPEGHQYLIGTLELKSNIDFHLQGDAELLVSTNQEDYYGDAAVIANGANDLTISGTGSINGRALEFMSLLRQA